MDEEIYYQIQIKGPRLIMNPRVPYGATISLSELYIYIILG